MQLNSEQFYNVQQKLNRVCGIYTPILFRNGIFEIYNLSEYDASHLKKKLENLDIVEFVNMSKSKKDFSHFDFSNGFASPKDLYILRGNIKFEDLEEDIEKHESLNPKLFDKDNFLLNDVREKLLEIANFFLDTLAEDEIKFELKDIKLVGSNCSYNYTKDSDIDLHLVANTKTLKCPDNLYPLLYSAYRSIFNKNYSPKIKGIPVEIFVETDDTEQLNDSVKLEARQQTALKSNGVYSVLNNKWIKEPVPEDIPEIDMDAFETEFEKWEDKYNELLKNPNIDSVDNFIEDLYDLRKTAIADDGEYSLGNLIFKEMRNLQYLDHLKELKCELISKNLSI